MQTTPRYGWRTPEEVGAPNNVPVDLTQLANDIEADVGAVEELAVAAAQHGEGLLSARGPAVDNAGRIWVVKGDLALLNGMTYISDGTSWVPLADQAPVGSELTYWGTDDPPGYLVEDHRAVSRTIYARLFAKIGTSAGPGNGTTTFNIPEGRGRVIVGLDPTDAAFDTLGKTGGEKVHILTVAESASHNHAQTAHGHLQNSHGHTQDPHDHDLGPANAIIVDYGGQLGAWVNDGPIPTTGALAGGSAAATNQNTTATNQNATAVNQATGGGGAHNNLQPYTVRNVIIKI